MPLKLHLLSLKSGGGSGGGVMIIVIHALWGWKNCFSPTELTERTKRFNLELRCGSSVLVTLRLFRGSPASSLQPSEVSA